MKKLNNKGMTLVELIVSFLIVSVAMLYFFQTLRTVQDIYKKANDETNEFVAKDYALRLLDKYIDEKGTVDGFCGSIIECSSVSLGTEADEVLTYKINDLKYQSNGKTRTTNTKLYRNY